MRVYRFRIGVLCAWLATVIVPIFYLCLLPGLAYIDPFGTETFAKPISSGEKYSISGLVRTPQANGGLAAFTMPILVYVWVNPRMAHARSGFAVIGASMFTFGWYMAILFPLNFVKGPLHSIGFVIGAFGWVIYSMGLLLRYCVHYSIWVVFAANILAGGIAVIGFSHQTVFVLSEYVIAITTAVFTPLICLIKCEYRTKLLKWNLIFQKR